MPALTELLPTELMLYLADFLMLGSLNALAQACTELHIILQESIDAWLTPALVKERLLLRWAAGAGREDLVEKLLAPPFNAEPDLHGYPERTSALHLAGAAGHTSIARRLISAGANVNYDGDSVIWGESVSPLHVAVKSAQLETTKLLLENGANPDCGYFCSKYGEEWTVPPLYDAISLRSIPLAKMLLEHAADVERGSYDGTPLAHALRLRDIDMMRFLLKTGGAQADADMWLVTWWPDPTERVEEMLPQPHQALMLYLALGLKHPEGDWSPAPFLLEEAERKDIMRLLLDYGATKKRTMDMVQMYLSGLAKAGDMTEDELLAHVDAIFVSLESEIRAGV